MTLAPAGRLVVSSGIIDEREAWVRDSLGPPGLELVETMPDGDWRTMVWRRGVTKLLRAPGVRPGRASRTGGPGCPPDPDGLRLQPGDEIELLDNSGWVYRTRLTGRRRGSRVAGEVVGRHRPETEPRARVALYQSLLKGQKMELVLQKGTELGVGRFIPVLSERCVSRPTAVEVGRKLERWEAVVREAAEQSGRSVLPEVAAGVFRGCLPEAARADIGLFAWEEERSSRDRTADRGGRAGRATGRQPRAGAASSAAPGGAAGGPRRWLLARRSWRSRGSWLQGRTLGRGYCARRPRRWWP